MNIDFLATPAIATWMSYTTIISCLIVLGAIAGHDAQRASGRPLRWIWIASIGIITALSIAAPFRDRVATSAATGKLESIEEIAGTTTVADDNNIRKFITIARSAAAAPLQNTVRRAQSLIGEAPAFVYQALALLWLGVSAALIAGFVISYRLMMRHAHRSRRAQIGGVTVRVSRTIGPAVIGLVPSQIVVPEWLCSRPTSEQEIAVAHETEHIRAADQWLLVTACAAVALMPWNPALWYCLSRLRLAVEIDCDRRVLFGGIPVSNYGSVLIALSALKPRLPVAMPAFPDSRSHLERRLIAMTQQPVGTRFARRIAGSILAAAVLITACESRLPTSADVEQMDVASAERKITNVGLLATTEPLYVVDGKSVDAESARELKASEIASISITKARQGTPGEIRIATENGVPVRLAPTIHKDKSIGGAPSRVTLTQSGARSAFAGLVVIDGVVAAPSQLSTLAPERILSMEVLKSAAAMRKYNDARAQHGVIIVTTKK